MGRPGVTSRVRGQEVHFDGGWGDCRKGASSTTTSAPFKPNRIVPLDWPSGANGTLAARPTRQSATPRFSGCSS